MPQLDLVALFSQLIWLVVVFTLYYVLMKSRILPELSRILKIRAR